MVLIFPWTGADPSYSNLSNQDTEAEDENDGSGSLNEDAQLPKVPR